MAPKGRDPNPSGLGRAIINRRTKDAKQRHESALFSVDVDSSKRLVSVTQERDLDEFLNTAQLAGTEFTAERRNIRVIPQTTTVSQNLYHLSEAEEKSLLGKQQENKQRLRVPRRPPWTKVVTTMELNRQEKAAFLQWRRGLAELQDRDKFLLTPFERNIEVWRQLWRVLERSHLIVQIVDARNPLRFRCEDLEDYVNDIEGTEGEDGTGKGKRRNLLLINKADLLTEKQRLLWADYLDSHGIRYVFYSAANVALSQEARRAATETNAPVIVSNHANIDKEHDEVERLSEEPKSEPESEDEVPDDAYFSAEEEHDPRAKILSADELEHAFLTVSPDLSAFPNSSGSFPSKLIVGLVGYPNVGKSSTINSLLGEKKVSVSSTPGKTKHFQTIHLSDSAVLCDCPGLVFPQFATTKAELVCDGVLPIDQLREYIGPVALVTKRLPKKILETTYGLTIKTLGMEEGGDGSVTPDSLLTAYAIARGFMRSGQGNPDEARAARYILKDYVNGKLLFCHPPPGVSELEFNQPTYQNTIRRLAGKKHAPVTRVGKDSDTFVSSNFSDADSTLLPAKAAGTRSRAIDQVFFNNEADFHSRPFIQQSGQFSRTMMYPHQHSVAADGTPIDPHHARMLAMLKDSEGKKHKKTKRVKQRSGKGYEI